MKPGKLIYPKFVKEVTVLHKFVVKKEVFAEVAELDSVRGLKRIQYEIFFILLEVN